MELKLRSIIVVAGNGNNGGGGMVAARRLKNWGLDVSLVLPKGMPDREIPQIQYQRAQDSGIRTHFQLPTTPTDEILVIDAYIGYNFRGELNRSGKQVIDWMRNTKLICLDIPSGVDSTTGLNQGQLRPLATLTLAWPKTGMLQLHHDETGQVYVADIGVPYWVYDNGKLYNRQKPDIRDIRAIAEIFTKYSYYPITITADGWSFQNTND